MADSAQDITVPLMRRASSAGSVSCRVPNCTSPLDAGYSTKYRICKQHYNATSVDLGDGLPGRFCQQCSKFHPLSEFDAGKLSCRAGLERHTQRRKERQARQRQLQLQRAGSMGSKRPSAEMSLDAPVMQDPRDLAQRTSSSSPCSSSQATEPWERRTRARSAEVHTLPEAAAAAGALLAPAGSSPQPTAAPAAATATAAATHAAPSDGNNGSSGSDSLVWQPMAQRPAAQPQPWAALHAELARKLAPQAAAQAAAAQQQQQSNDQLHQQLLMLSAAAAQQCPTPPPMPDPLPHSAAPTPEQPCPAGPAAWHPNSGPPTGQPGTPDSAKASLSTHMASLLRQASSAITPAAMAAAMAPPPVPAPIPAPLPAPLAAPQLLTLLQSTLQLLHGVLSTVQMPHAPAAPQPSAMAFPSLPMPATAPASSQQQQHQKHPSSSSSSPLEALLGSCGAPAAAAAAAAPPPDVINAALSNLRKLAAEQLATEMMKKQLAEQRLSKEQGIMQLLSLVQQQQLLQ